MAEVPYNPTSTVSPDAAAPDARIRVNANPDAFGAAIGRGLERAGAGLTQASDNLFSVNAFYDKVAVDDQINQLIDTSNKIRRGDPTKTVVGPDGQAQPDVGYLGTTGRTALDQREPTMKLLDDAIKSGKDNLKSDSQRLAFEQQSRRMRAQWVDQIGAHSDTQFKSWAASVNASAAQHAINHIAANPEGEEFAHGAADLINARVQEVQSKFGDDPALKTEAVAKAKQEALKTQLTAIGARNPSRAIEILDKNREIAGADYPALMEHFRGRADQQDGIAAADRMIATHAAQPRGGSSFSDQLSSGMGPGYKSGVVNGAIPAEGRVLLDRIASGESSGRYNVRYGGRQDKTFEGYADHPRVAEPITSGPDVGKTSSAAGRYQFIGSTWDAEAKKLGLKDFSPANQDAAAWDLAQTEYKAKTGKDLLTVLKSGDHAAINDVPRQLSGQWSSLPGGRQPAGGTGAGTPVQALSRSEGEMKLAVLSDPSMADRPQMQSAALNRINVYFSAQRETATNDASAFKLKLQNSTAEALDTGSVKTPLSQDEFTSALGEAEGQRQYAEYQANVQLGADMRAIASMSPEQIAQMQTHYQPEPGSDNYVAQGRRADQLNKAIAQNEQLKAKDPAMFLISRTDAGNEAWQHFQGILTDPKASPDQRKVAAGMFAETMKSEQLRLGVAPDQVKAVPDWYVQRLVGSLHTAAADGTVAPIGPRLEAEQKMWGDAWPSITRQIPKDAGPLVRVLASGVPAGAAQKLQQVENLKLGDILKDQNDERAKQITTDVLNAFKPFASSLAGNAGGLALFNDFRGQAEKLAASYVLSGKTSSDAATQAFNDLVGAKYTFQSGYRVPKDAGVAPDQVAQGSVIALRELGNADVRPAADTIGGLSPEYLTESKIKSLQRDGKWVTSPREDGLMLTHNDQAVRRPDGQPLVLTWKQLGDLSARAKSAREQIGAAAIEASKAAGGGPL
ncbi:hypothetical protein SAMN05216337_1017149 [Bradyrhizobium brasilense]|uniref:Lysozyme n=1 Tax=Bradyrhizobium brasilense TaxID=1419277 RepID=A0A1G6YZ43_9BRAD|nr:hypothetical protein [Bradyrhizobium brasilense]SDD95581.1 hypothetical protein SAMN05216337_1017149 [Bradyrhizobium brasilense]